MVLVVPCIDSYYGCYAHPVYGWTKGQGVNYDDMVKMLTSWRQQAARLEAGEISKEEYDQWRYRYPEFDTTQRWAKVPSQELSDLLAETLKDSGK